MKRKVFEFYPAVQAKLLISVPHAGEWIPEEFVPFLTTDQKTQDCDLDFKVNELIDITELQQNQVSVLVAQVHRICVDLNRSPDVAVLNWSSNTKGQKLVVKEPESELKLKLRDAYYSPYYDQLETMLKDIPNFIDLHSMPSRPTDYHLQKNPSQSLKRPEFCISDLNGKTASLTRRRFVVNFLESEGYKPQVNDPYLGGHLTESAHGFGAQALQIETRRNLYMDESQHALIEAKAAKLKSVYTKMFIQFAKSF